MSRAQFDELKLVEKRRELASFVSEGRLDKSLVDLIVVGANCVPLECELLDYKEAIGEDRHSKAKAVLQIVSLHNTYGGYIVYGVREEASETEFRVIGIEKGAIDLESLKALVREYTGERLQLSLQYFSTHSSGGNTQGGSTLAILFVPKRTSSEPLAFGKNGPGDKYSNLLFGAEDVYYRRGDECVLAKGKTVLHLAGPRICPYERTSSAIERFLAPQIRLQHNLPDRGLICSKFIGRGDEIDQLWAWTADSLSHVKVLAGEGGLGKTSIAYQFAEEVCVSPEAEVERVVWLTAKQRQFSGILNVSVDIPETHFSSYPELLNVLAKEFGYLDSDLEGLSEKRMKRLLQEGAELIPTLVIVDDVDTLEPEEQRKALETGFIFGGSKSRLLMTTRINQSYSTDIAIQVKGFAIDEYREFVVSLHERYPYANLDAGQVEKMHVTTGGNPLFTESLYRLMRGMNANEAIRSWRGHLGEDARAAALRREIEQLTPEAKRVLLAAAVLNESSVAELSEVTGYSEPMVNDRLDELQSIYLVSAPMFTTERRVKIATNTRVFALNTPSRLAADHARVEKRAVELKTKVKHGSLKRDNPLVGGAISQAMAQLIKGDVESAIATVSSVRKQLKDHPDLLVMHARCLLKLVPPKADEARRLARQAYESGIRKDILFDIWYKAESSAGNNSGAAEAAACALEARCEPQWQWLVQRAAAIWHVAGDQEKSGNYDRAIADYWLVADDLKVAQDLTRSDVQSEIRQQRFAAHDAIWNILRRADKDSMDVPARAISDVGRMIKTNDFRVSTYLRLCEALKWMCAILSRDRGPIAEGLRNLAEQRFREVRELVKSPVSQRRSDERFEFVEQQLRDAEDEFATVVRRRGIASA